MADMLRHRPWDFGAVGDPLVLGADAVLSRADGGVEMSGVECIKGFQRLVVLAHVMREVSGAHLDHANVRVEIVVGADRARVRRLSEEAGDYANPTHPQDRLSRCPHLKRIAAEFRTEGGFFDHRRGVVAGPHPCGYSMADVTRALACTASSPWPTLTHQVSTLDGLHALWRDVDGLDYRSLIHEGVHAFSVQRAVEAREAALKVVKRLCGASPAGHEHLLKYAPELITWAACRKLPLDHLHRSDRRARDWSREVHGPFPDMVAEVAQDLVERYRQVRGDSKVFVHEAKQLDVWLDVLDPSRTRRHP
ncbi:hypothetical protein ACFW2Y_06300 [Streptomyces sp. NPDC058877]|uniref:hypothetical protein n=1 Tax=unclassified Streptomyces TaxID=2593676 RepID=UPI0036B313DD